MVGMDWSMFVECVVKRWFVVCLRHVHVRVVRTMRELHNAIKTCICVSGLRFCFAIKSACAKAPFSSTFSEEDIVRNFLGILENYTQNLVSFQEHGTPNLIGPSFKLQYNPEKGNADLSQWQLVVNYFQSPLDGKSGYKYRRKFANTRRDKNRTS